MKPALTTKQKELLLLIVEHDGLSFMQINRLLYPEQDRRNLVKVQLFNANKRLKPHGIEIKRRPAKLNYEVPIELFIADEDKIKLMALL